MRCMAYFNWTTRKDGQMFGLTRVKLVRVLLEWDVHVTPWWPASFSFKNTRNDISQHTIQGGRMGEAAICHGSKFLQLLRNHKDVDK
jgi:hypothetical protein